MLQPAHGVCVRACVRVCVNLLPSSQEFFQDVDSFEAQSRDHVSQLESTSQLLLGQREVLLGDGKGAQHLLEHMIEGIREGYKLVEDQVRLMGVVIVCVA